MVAFALLTILEITVRLVDPMTLIPYDRGQTNYEAVRLYLQSYGAADIAFVGSSRTLAAIAPKTTKDHVAKLFDQKISVANYACDGAWADEIVPMLEYILQQKKIPQILFYGVSPEQISRDLVFSERSAIFWDSSDWFRIRRKYGSSVDHSLPVVIRNEIANHCYLFRYRHRVSFFIKELGNRLRGQKAPFNRIFMDHMQAKTTGNIHRLKVTKELKDDVYQHIQEKHLVNGKYPFNSKKIAMIEQIAQRCQELGVHLVFFEIPNANVFNHYLPTEVPLQFRKIFRQIAQKTDQKFVSVNELGVVFSDEYFADPVHLNEDGAQELTEALFNMGFEFIHSPNQKLVFEK